MSGTYKCSGGVRIGLFEATWPFVRLTVTADSLRIAVYFHSSYKFTPGDVSAITVHHGTYFCSIRIAHCVPEYPASIVFVVPCTKVDAVLAGINATGFSPAAPAAGEK